MKAAIHSQLAQLVTRIARAELLPRPIGSGSGTPLAWLAFTTLTLGTGAGCADEDPTSPDNNLAVLVIEKTDSPDPVLTGGQITYTIVVRNTGPDRATNVKVRDVPGAGLSGVTMRPGALTNAGCIAGVTPECTASQLGVSGILEFIVTATAPSTPGPVTNTASATAEESVGLADAEVQVTTMVVAPPPLQCTPPEAQISAETKKLWESVANCIGGTAPLTVTVTQTANPCSGPTVGIADELVTVTATGDEPGTCSVAVQVRDSSPLQQSATISITAQIFDPLVIISTGLPGAGVGTPYLQGIGVLGGSGSATFALTSGSLPAGMTLNASTGLISGTPTVSGIYRFNAQATNAQLTSQTATRSLELEVVEIFAEQLPAGKVGVGYVKSVFASPEMRIAEWSLIQGALPPGLAMAILPLELSIGGVPTTAGTFTFTLEVVGNAGGRHAREFSITIAPADPPPPPPGLQCTLRFPNVTSEVSQLWVSVADCAGGTAPLTTTVVQSSGPCSSPSVAVESGTVTVSGTGSTAGTCSVSVQVRDASAAQQSTTFAVTAEIFDPLVIISTGMPGAGVGTPYAQGIGVLGGSGSVSFTLISGSLPPGLALNGSTGLITGTPLVSGIYVFGVQATNTQLTSQTATRSLELEVVEIATSQLHPGKVGVNYNDVVLAFPIARTSQWSLIQGGLPPGLVTVFNTGFTAIVGVPTTAGTFTFTLEVVGDAGGRHARELSITIAPADPPPPTGSNHLYSINTSLGVLSYGLGDEGVPSFQQAFSSPDFTQPTEGTFGNSSLYVTYLSKHIVRWGIGASGGLTIGNSLSTAAAANEAPFHYGLNRQGTCGTLSFPGTGRLFVTTSLLSPVGTVNIVGGAPRETHYSPTFDIAYVLDGTKVHVLNSNPATCVLSGTGTTLDFPDLRDIVVDPDGQFLYGITFNPIGNSSTLIVQPLNGSGMPAGAAQTTALPAPGVTLVAHPELDIIYEVQNAPSAGLRKIDIDPVSGAATVAPTAALLNGIDEVAIPPGGGIVYYTNVATSSTARICWATLGVDGAVTSAPTCITDPARAIDSQILVAPLPNGGSASLSRIRR